MIHNNAAFSDKSAGHDGLQRVTAEYLPIISNISCKKNEKNCKQNLEKAFTSHTPHTFLLLHSKTYFFVQGEDQM